MNTKPVEKIIPAPDLSGRGIQGWHVENDAGQRLYDLLEVDPERPIGGDCARDQVWDILEGEGDMSIDGRFVRRRVTADNTVQVREGERALLIARTHVRVAIRPVEQALISDQRPFMHS